MFGPRTNQSSFTGVVRRTDTPQTPEPELTNRQLLQLFLRIVWRILRLPQ